MALGHLPRPQVPRRQEGHRGGEEGLRAERLENPEYLDTLAAAHAEAGVFDQAVRWQQEAIKRKPAGSDNLKEFQDRLALYRDKKPYREP